MHIRVFVLCGFFISNAMAVIAVEGGSVQKAISEVKRCMATWSIETSKAGQKTEASVVRELGDQIQHHINHSNEHHKIWA